jgi:hypothetical protein
MECVGGVAHRVAEGIEPVDEEDHVDVVWELSFDRFDVFEKRG